MMRHHASHPTPQGQGTRLISSAATTRGRLCALPEGPPRTAHKLTHIIYSMLRYGQDCVDARLRTLRETVSAAGVARRQASGGTTGLPTGTNVRRRGPHHVRTSRRANRRVTTLVSGEQSYARIRAVQRRLTGVAVSGCVCSWRDVLSGRRPSRRWCILPVGEHGPGVLRRHHW